MTDTLTLYGNPHSRSRIARWMLEETGQPYEVVVLGYADSMKSAEYLAVNPMGKVPALTHGRTVVTEAAAICAYLADAFPEAGLAPAPADRGAYHRWMFFAAGPLEAAVTNTAMGFVLPPGRERMAGYGSYADTLNALEGWLDGRTYVAGDRFTAADVYVGSAVGWGLMFGTIEKRPAFERYWAGLAGRPALARANELDDALAQKQG